MYWQYSFTKICETCMIYLYICIVKIILWTYHHRTFVNLILWENSSPIVFIEVSTIVLKEGRSERGYNPETPSNFLYHSRVVLIRWHAHLSWDWWRLPSGEAALASPLWQAPSNSSLDWAIVGVTLGPDSEVSVWVLVTQCWGITLGQGSWHLSRTSPGRVQGEGLCWGQQEAGTQADEDLGWPRKSPGGRPMLRTTGGWDSGV